MIRSPRFNVLLSATVGIVLTAGPLAAQEQAKVPNLAGKTSKIPEPTVVLKPGEVPKIEFETPTWNFGKVAEGKILNHEFWFKNTGTGPLEILRVKPGCGCAKTAEHNKIVQPGERGRIPIEISTLRLPVDVSKRVTVNTNCGGESKEIHLAIVGQLWYPLTTTPQTASFGTVFKDRVEKAGDFRTVAIVNTTKTPAKMKIVRSTNPSFSASLKTIEEGKTYELKVKIVGGLKKFSNVGDIEIDTGLKEKPVLAVPVSLYIAPTLRVAPRELKLYLDRPGDRARDIYIVNNSETPMELTELTATSPELVVELHPVQPGKVFRIVVRVPMTYEVNEEDSINITTTHPETPIVNIPIRVLKRSGASAAAPASPKGGKPADSAAGKGSAGSGGKSGP